MEQKEKFCCGAAKEERDKSFLPGVLFGLIPHSFCLAFAIFSVIGAVAAAAFLKQFLLIPYFFHILVFLSLIMATFSAALYLKRNQCLCVSGVKNKWKYISTLYVSTILVNLLMFFVVFPALANTSSKEPVAKQNNLADLTISVDIPCTGHAPLIIDEIKKNPNVQSVKFSIPNKFEIKYNPLETSPAQIASLDIFKTYEATIIN